jgi:hypothetical protein
VVKLSTNERIYVHYDHWSVLEVQNQYVRLDYQVSLYPIVGNDELTVFAKEGDERLGKGV